MLLYHKFFPSTKFSSQQSEELAFFWFILCFGVLVEDVSDFLMHHRQVTNLPPFCVYIKKKSYFCWFWVMSVKMI